MSVSTRPTTNDPSSHTAKADDERHWVAIYGTPVSHSVSSLSVACPATLTPSERQVAPALFDTIFPAIGLPRHKYTTVDCRSLLSPGNEWETAKQQPNFLGSCITMPLSPLFLFHSLRFPID